LELGPKFLDKDCLENVTPFLKAMIDRVKGKSEKVGGVDNTRTTPSTEGAGMGGTIQNGMVAKAQTYALHDRGLLLIGIFKMVKAAFFVCVGFGALHLIQKNLGDEVLALVKALRRDPEGRLVQLLLEKVDLVDAHRLRQIGFGSFAYAGLALTEGTGLLLEKPWAEYLTLLLTISFLPWELFELVRHPSWLRVGVLLTNLAVLGYLVWLLQRKRRAVG
jgi:uncharacterized membrane protein (DUF2068 family)